jgi:hypothetical protein
MAAVNYLERELGGLVDKLQVTETEKEYLRSRWLSQIMWMDGKANHSRRSYHAARTFIIFGGILVPAMITFPLFCNNTDGPFHIATIALSLAVALTAALEGLFHVGDKWRHYRANVESLKTEGWLFSLKSGPYKRYKDQSEAFPSFAERIEEILQRDVSEYLETVGGDEGAHTSVMRVG